MFSDRLKGKLFQESKAKLYFCFEDDSCKKVYYYNETNLEGNPNVQNRAKYLQMWPITYVKKKKSKILY